MTSNQNDAPKIDEFHGFFMYLTCQYTNTEQTFDIAKWKTEWNQSLQSAKNAPPPPKE